MTKAAPARARILLCDKYSESAPKNKIKCIDKAFNSVDICRFLQFRRGAPVKNAMGAQKFHQIKLWFIQKLLFEFKVNGFAAPENAGAPCSGRGKNAPEYRCVQAAIRVRIPAGSPHRRTGPGIGGSRTGRPGFVPVCRMVLQTVSRRAIIAPELNRKSSGQGAIPYRRYSPRAVRHDPV